MPMRTVFYNLHVILDQADALRFDRNGFIPYGEHELKAYAGTLGYVFIEFLELKVLEGKVRYVYRIKFLGFDLPVQSLKGKGGSDAILSVLHRYGQQQGVGGRGVPMLQL